MLSLRSIIQSRGFSSTSVSFASAVARKSFNKKSVYDKSKNRKGSGNDKNFKDTLLKKDFRKSALKEDELLIKNMESVNVSNFESVKNSYVKYPAENLKKLHIAGSFKPNQYNELYSEPLTLLREKEDSKLLEIVNKSTASSSSDNTFLVNGQSGIGKSTLLAHFQNFALTKNEGNAILFPISNAELLVDGSNDFKLNPETKKYDQPMYTKVFIRKFKSLNKDVLSKIPLSKEIIPVTSIYKKSQQKVSGTLLDFVDYILKASTLEANTTFAFKTILEELSIQDKIPVYLTIDNFSAFIQHGLTKYRNTDNERIYFQDFTVADQLLQFVSGEKTFKKGAIMIATSGDHRLNNNGTLDVVVGDKAACDFAYSKLRDFDLKLANRLLKNNTLQKFEISKFNVDECNAMVSHLFNFNLIHNEYDLESKLLTNSQSKVLEQIAQKKYFISGNGNPKLLMDSCILSYA